MSKKLFKENTLDPTIARYFILHAFRNDQPTVNLVELGRMIADLPGSSNEFAAGAIRRAAMDGIINVSEDGSNVSLGTLGKRVKSISSPRLTAFS